jgi:hypothetical protein
MTEIGRIEIINADGIFTDIMDEYNDGDILISYYDSDTDTITVELNGTPVTDGQPMFAQYQNNGTISVVQAGYQFCQGSDLVTFGSSGVLTREFPYFPKNVIINSPTCSSYVCRLINYGSPVATKASSQTTADGTIKVQASNVSQVNFGVGSFDFLSGIPGTLILAAPEPINNIYEATITGLLPGTYEIQAKDVNGCTAFYFVTVGFEITSQVKYFSEFRARDNSRHKVELFFRNFSGSSTELLIHTANPLMIDSGGLKLGDVDLNKFITALETKITYNLRSGNNYSFIDEFANLSDRDVRLDHSKWNGTSWVLQNRGYVILDNYSEPYKGAPYDMSFFANDGLSFLSEYDYPTTSGRASFLSIIATCLQFTDIGNGIVSLMNLYEDSMVQPVQEAAMLFDTGVLLITGDYVDFIGSSINIAGTTSNNGTFTVLTKSLVSGNTRLTFSQSITNELANTAPLPTFTTIADPLTQMYLDQFVFQGKKCDQVLGEVLTLCPAKSDSVGATITSKFGKWYIYPVEATDNTTNYREFDQNGVFVGLGSINMFRFVKPLSQTSRIVLGEGSNTLRLDRTFKEIIVNEKLLLSESIAPLFVSDLSNNNQGGFAGYGSSFPGWSNSLNGTTGELYIDNVNGKSVLRSRISLVFASATQDDFNNNAFTSTIGELELTQNDSFLMSFNLFIDPTRITVRNSNPLPYVVQKYSIKIGSGTGTTYYYNGVEFILSDSEIVVELFVTEYNTDKQIELVINQMPEILGKQTLPYEIKIYSVNPISSINSNEFANPVSATEMGKRGVPQKLLTIDATSFPLGYRIQVYSFRDSKRTITYVSLQADGVADSRNFFEALNSDFLWKVDAVCEINGNTGRSQLTNTNTYISDVLIRTLPNGQPLSDQNQTVVQSSPVAPRNYEVTLPFSDLDAGITNGKQLVKNYITLDDGTPTASWGGQTLKNILRDTYARQYKFSNRIINFTGRTDIDVNPFNTIIIEADNDRALRFYEFSENVRRLEISGTIMEIGSDTPITVGEYSDDYSNDYFN